MISLILLFIFPLSLAAWNPHIPLAGRVLPVPRKIVYHHENRTVTPGNIRIELGDLKDWDILKYAKETYENSWFFPHAKSYFEGKSRPTKVNDQLVLKVTVKNPKVAGKVYPQHGMNEKYVLTVYEDQGPAYLEAEDVWGALRGLETFSQLIFLKDGQYYIRTAHIKDWPEYPFRGLLIDSGRHFLPKNVILRQIDLLAQNKMNVLHWHVSDSESFPYVSKKFPEMSKNGAYAQDYVYTPEDVQDIVEHARLRGVRVLVEFDTPGHMASWRGIPGLMTNCSTTSEPNVLDPSKNSTFKFLEDFFTEIKQVFPESWIHLGGDEISFFSDCWKHNAEVVKFMEKQGWGNNVTALVNYYFDRFQSIIEKVYGQDGSNIVLWEEIFRDNNPRPKSIAHVWLNRNLVAETTKKGHRTIVSQGWYLDHIKGGEDWSYMYTNDPRGFIGTKEQKDLVIGGEACMWGEFIDATNLETTVWPRASAAAERLWSNPNTSSNDAIPRMFEQRCRSIGRGFFVRPAHGPDFCPYTVDFPYPA